MSSKSGFFKRIKQLSTPQKLLFAAALCQRMQPNFKNYCEQHRREAIQPFNDALSIAWQIVYDKKLQVNYASLQLKLEAIVPDTDNALDDSVYPAFDAVVALITVFNALESQVDDDLNNISKLASHTVRQLILQQTGTELTGDALNDFVYQHPLMQEEQRIQMMLLDWVEQGQALQKEQVRGLRQELMAY